MYTICKLYIYTICKLYIYTICKLYIYTICKLYIYTICNFLITSDFSVFLPFTFLLSFSIVSPTSVLYSPVYNIFALIGGKAPFTHSLLLRWRCNCRSTRSFATLVVSFNNKLCSNKSAMIRTIQQDNTTSYIVREDIRFLRTQTFYS